MKMGYVITCNGRIEHVFIGPRQSAEEKKERLAANNFKAMSHIYESRQHYDVNHNWEIISAPTTVTRADEMN